MIINGKEYPNCNLCYEPEDINWPARVEVIPGVMGRTPTVSKPHIGKYGLIEEDGDTVKITLDDGTILRGYECWWKPIKGG